MPRKLSYGEGAGGALLLIGLGILGYKYRHELQRFVNNVPADSKYLADIKLKIAGFDRHQDKSVTANINFINPTSEQFRVQSINGHLVINGRAAGTIRMFGDTMLRPNDQGTLPVNVQVLNDKLFTRGATGMFTGKININNTLRNLQMSFRL